jgi:hypothetical protein
MRQPDPAGYMVNRVVELTICDGIIIHDILPP